MKKTLSSIRYAGATLAPTVLLILMTAGVRHP